MASVWFDWNFKIMYLSNHLKVNFLPDEQLYFIHVPKCAGTSFISLVDERYIIDEIIPTHYDLKKLQEEITNDQLSSYRFIRGHFPFDLIVPRLRKYPRITTFLREPVVRLISNFQMRQRVVDPLNGLQGTLYSLTLDEFLARKDLMSIFANRATRLIGGTVHDGSGAEIPNLELAKMRLSKFDFVGIVEKYEDSLSLFSYVFDFPAMQSDRVLNVSPNREKRDEISPHTLMRVAETEWADIELYKFGREIFEKQFASMKREIADDVRYPTPPKVNSVHEDFSLVDPGMGWHVAERHPQYGVYRWSGPDIVSHLRYSLTTDCDMILRFDVLQAIAPDVLDSLTVQVNGEIIHLKKRVDGLASVKTFEGRIPREILLLSHRWTNLTLRVNRTICPKDVDSQNLDERLLGVCYHKLSLTPA